MAGIWNINSAYDVNTKKLFKRLSFEVGQNFMAKIVNLDKLNGDVILKLLDGWKFSAKLEQPMNKALDGLVKFEVEGFEDGKIKLKIVDDSSSNSGENTLEKSLDSILKSCDMDVSEENYQVLNKMMEHDIPLTKENISHIKTLTDFINTINKEPGEEDNFINNYINSRNFIPGDKTTESAKDVLKGFLNEFKNLSVEDLLTIVENNINLSEKNIKSFNEVFKDSLKIYNDVQDISNNSNDYIEPQDSENSYLLKNIDMILNKEDKLELSQDYKSQVGSLNKDIEQNSRANDNVQTYDLMDDVKEKQSGNSKNSNINVENDIKDNLPDVEKNDDLHNADTKIENDNLQKDNVNVKAENDDTTVKMKNNSNNINENSVKLKDVKNGKTIKVQKNIEELSQAIRNEINEKTEHVKDMIKTILDQKNDTGSDKYNNITTALNKNINDFQVFNTVSNQYYYMDLPLNIDNYEYKFKLMIKDDRKDGKKIDSTDLKIAASVNTENMGVVDAYIAVNNSNMKVDIKCDSDWVKFLDEGKSIIVDKLKNMGYNTYFCIGKRKEEMNIVNCRNFFEDKHIGMINVRA